MCNECNITICNECDMWNECDIKMCNECDITNAQIKSSVIHMCLWLTFSLREFCLLWHSRWKRRCAKSALHCIHCTKTVVIARIYALPKFLWRYFFGKKELFPKEDIYGLLTNSFLIKLWDKYHNKLVDDEMLGTNNRIRYIYAENFHFQRTRTYLLEIAEIC